MGILLVADGGLERQRLLGDLEHLTHLLEWHTELLGEFLRRGLAADLVEHLAADMVRYAGEFGFSPAARARIAAGPGSVQPASKFDGLFGG
jgi:hypothetical protein